MKLILIPAIFMMLTVVSGCNITSKTASMYEYDGQSWLVIRETEVSDDLLSGDVDLVSTKTLAIMRPDGTIQAIARETSSDVVFVRPTGYRATGDDYSTREAKNKLGENPFDTIRGVGKFVRRFGQGSIICDKEGNYSIRLDEPSGGGDGGGDDHH